MLGPNDFPRAKRRTVRDTIAETVPTPGRPGWKKFFGFFMTVATVILGRKFGLTQQETALIAGAGSAYVVGQGLADFGKERTERTVIKETPKP